MRSSIKTLTVVALTAGALVAAPAAFAADTADNTVVQAVAGGALSASVTGGALTDITTAHSDQLSEAAPLSLTADDLTGTAAGWTVTQQITELAYSGDNAGSPIAAVNFSVTPGAIIANGGAVLTGVAAGGGGSLETAKTVLTAAAGSGVGNYTQTNAATLTVPANSRVGTYTGTLTTTITTGTP